MSVSLADEVLVDLEVEKVHDQIGTDIDKAPHVHRSERAGNLVVLEAGVTPILPGMV